MSDLQFFQNQARGPQVWGDLELTPCGDLAVLDRPSDLDTQDAALRLLTDADAQTGFELFPQVGASLSRFIGALSGLDQLQAIDRACEQALRSDRRFPQRAQCRSVQLAPGEVRIYVMVPNGGGGFDLLSPPVGYSAERGVAPLEEQAPANPWIWRRGAAMVQQSVRLWRAWYGSSVLWRLTPDGLTTRNVREEALGRLGMFHEPFLAYGGGYLFCGRGPREGYYTPRAWTTSEGWILDQPLSEVASLPRYNLPDGVWCDEETGWNIAIIISGTTAGQFNEETQRWEFRSVRTTDTL